MKIDMAFQIKALPMTPLRRFFAPQMQNWSVLVPSASLPTAAPAIPAG